MNSWQQHWVGTLGEYRADNLANWNERAPAHATSRDYGTPQLISDPQALSDVVRFDIPRLGYISGLRVLHLQCHIGTDTISLARLGAKVTGLDFSDQAIEQGIQLAAQAGVDVAFVQADAYQAVEVLGPQTFDLVFTGIGALCWLPHIRPWAQVVSQLLVPGGRLFLREGHPMLWSVDEKRDDGLLTVHYPYFETPNPVTEVDSGSYVHTATTFASDTSHSWNHGLGEIITALHDAGMTLTMLEEHQSVPWNAIPGQMSLHADGEWRLNAGAERLPLSYTLQARRGSTLG
jgi:SAM-dependent methyltransferase